MQTAQQINDRDQVIEIDGKLMTRGDLTDAFNLVCDKTNWKMPIDCEVVLQPGQIDAVHKAVIFFTGAPCEFDWLGKGETDKFKWRVRAPGYYKTCGA